MSFKFPRGQWVNGCGIVVHGSALKSWLWTSFDNVYLIVKALYRNFDLLSLNYFWLIDLHASRRANSQCLKLIVTLSPMTSENWIGPFKLEARKWNYYRLNKKRLSLQVRQHFIFYHYYYTPAPPKVEWEYTGFTRCLSVRLSVRPSIRPSVDKVSRTFWKNIGSIHFFFLKNSHLCSTRLQNRNLYWIFLDEVGSDQSRGILSPFIGTVCLFGWHFWKYVIHNMLNPMPFWIGKFDGDALVYEMGCRSSHNPVFIQSVFSIRLSPHDMSLRTWLC